MEQNLPMMAKKIWKIMRVAFFMLRKGICKRKILMDLNMMVKRGKIAGKALHHIMFHLNHHHHHHHGSNPVSDGVDAPSPIHHFSKDNPPREYEFSCSNTPLYRHYFTNNKRKNQHKNDQSFYYMPSPMEDMNNNIEAVNNMFDKMMLSGNDADASPAWAGLGFGKSRAVRQIRITDSPFPVQSSDDGAHVDEAAEQFIHKFYSQLKQQKYY